MMVIASKYLIELVFDFEVETASKTIDTTLYVRLVETAFVSRIKTQKLPDRPAYTVVRVHTDAAIVKELNLSVDYVEDYILDLIRQTELGVKPYVSKEFFSQLDRGQIMFLRDDKYLTTVVFSFKARAVTDPAEIKRVCDILSKFPFIAKVKQETDLPHQEGGTTFHVYADPLKAQNLTLLRMIELTRQALLSFDVVTEPLVRERCDSRFT